MLFRDPLSLWLKKMPWDSFGKAEKMIREKDEAYLRKSAKAEAITQHLLKLLFIRVPKASL